MRKTPTATTSRIYLDSFSGTAADLPPSKRTPGHALRALASITPSRTNPRKHFSLPGLEELAASILTSGVHQPVLVRPLPPARLQDTFEQRLPGQPLPTWELITGERRLRASQLAKLGRVTG